MLQNKRIFALALIIAIISQFSIVFADIIDNAESNSYEDAVNLLISLNIVEKMADGTYPLDREVTRAEFAVVAANISGFTKGTTSSGYDTIFIDVPSWHWAAESIYHLYKLGVITNSDGYFLPENKIKLSEALKILVSLIGYDFKAQQYGGYPQGYLMISNEIGLISKLSKSITSNELVTSGMMSQLIVNAATIDIVDTVTYSKDNNTSVTVKDYTLLSKFRNIYKSKGVVTASYITGLTTNALNTKSDIEIDGKLYRDTLQKYSTLLGQYVDFYYEKNDDEDEMKIIYLLPNKMNVVTTITADKMNISSSELSLENITYYDQDENTKSIKVARDADFIFNGKMYLGVSIDTLKITNGRIIIIDNDNDNVGEVVFIESYQDYIVNSVDVNYPKIYDKTGKKLDISSIEEGDIKVINQNGEELTFASLKKNDVVSAMISNDGRSATLYVNTKSVFGEIKEIYSENSKNKVVIEGNTYNLSPLYSVTLEVGDKTLFFINISGEIVGSDILKNEGNNYGYILSKPATKTQLDTIVQCKIFTQNGTSEIMKFAKEVNFTAKSGTDDNIPAILLLTKPEFDSPYVAQLARYKLNSKGEITDLSFALDGISKKRDHISGQFVLNKSYPSVLYRTTQFFADEYSFNSSTVLFNIPGGTETLSEDNIRIVSSADFYGDQSYKVNIYDADNTLNAGAVVIYDIEARKEAVIPYKFQIIKKITTVVDKNGDSVYKLTTYEGKKETTYTQNKETTTAELKAFLETAKIGDMCRIVTDSKGFIYMAKKLASADISTGIDYGVKTYSSIYGKVYGLNSNNISIAYGDGNNDIRAFKLSSNTTFYIFTGSGNAVNMKIASLGDAMESTNKEELSMALLNGSKVFFVYHEAGATAVIIFQ